MILEVTGTGKLSKLWLFNVCGAVVQEKGAWLKVAVGNGGGACSAGLAYSLSSNTMGPTVNDARGRGCAATHQILHNQSATTTNEKVLAMSDYGGCCLLNILYSY